MKVNIKEWNAVATWRWDMPEDDVCGICRVQFDGTCPTCKFPGDDCSLRKYLHLHLQPVVFDRNGS
jgi:anaphase-promoting complex subunit 11